MPQKQKEYWISRHLIVITPAESKIYEKEQNLLKLHGNENVSQAENTMAKTTTAKPSESENFSNMMQFMQMFNNAAFMPPSPTRMANFSPHRGGISSSKTASAVFVFWMLQVRDMSHIRIDCPKK